MWDLADTSAPRVVVDLAWERSVSSYHRVSTDGRLLVLWHDNKVEIFELLTGAKVLGVEAERYSIGPASLSPNGLRLVCADERRVRVWDLESRLEQAVFYSDAEITAIAWASDDLLIAGTAGGHVHRLQLRDGTSPSP